MDMLPQQESATERNVQASRGKIPLEIKEYFYSTCSDQVFDRLFRKYEKETSKKSSENVEESINFVVSNLSAANFKIVLLLAEDEIIYGLEKEREHNLHPTFREAILKRHLNEEAEKQLLEDKDVNQERNN